MHALRSSTSLIRWVLVCYFLILGTAGASAWVQPKVMELVCSASGDVKVVFTDHDGQVHEASQHTLECSLCLPAMLPPPEPRLSSAAPQPLSHALLPTQAAHIASLVGAPLPPRGPPALG
jgi:hypothetical protein